MDKMVYGVDVGGTTVKIGLFDENGNMLHSTEIPTRKEKDGSLILPDIAEYINRNKTAQVCGIGIGVPGPVLEDGTVNKCVNLSWGVINVEKELEKLTSLPVKAGNDANVAALGESFRGSASGYNDVVMITLGTGVGGGVIIGGRPVNGYYGAAGELGHMPVVYDETEKCNCGKCGCLEQVASATGIVRVAKKIGALSDRESFTAKDVFDEAKAGDALCVKAVDKLGEYLGIALANAACMIDPECFVIGGGVSKAGEYLIENIEKWYRMKAFHASRETKIVLAQLGNDAGMYGAAKLILQERSYE